MDIGFELICERGSIAFHGERANELRLYRHGEPAGQQGFRTIRIDGAHPDYGAFIPAPAHGLGFNDLKTIELHEFLLAIAARPQSRSRPRRGVPHRPDLRGRPRVLRQRRPHRQTGGGHPTTSTKDAVTA